MKTYSEKQNKSLFNNDEFEVLVLNTKKMTIQNIKHQTPEKNKEILKETEITCKLPFDYEEELEKGKIYVLRTE